jgi:hypothetical protein
MKITSLRDQIFETQEFLGWQHTVLGSPEELMIKNQLEIMRALFRIQEDLQRVKKSYPHPDCGPA